MESNLWSVRGKYRRIIEPAIKDAFTENVKTKLLNMSQQSDDWNMLIQKDIIKPFFQKVVFITNFNDDDVSIKFNIEKYKNYPLTFWQFIFIELFNTYGYQAPSKKGIQTFLNKVTVENKVNVHSKEISLSNNCKCNIKNNDVCITFKKKSN